MSKKKAVEFPEQDMTSVRFKIKSYLAPYDMMPSSATQFLTVKCKCEEDAKRKPWKDDPLVSPFCVDGKSRKVYLVKCRGQHFKKLCQEPFLYQAQLKHASTLYECDIDDYIKEAQTLSLRKVGIGRSRGGDDLIKSQQLTFIFSTGRCGSTLLTQMLGGISEPDVYNVFHKGNVGTLKEEEQRSLCTALTRHLCHLFTASKDHDAREGKGKEQRKSTHVVIKLRSWSVDSVQLLRGCFPDANLIFLCRRAEPVVSSFVGIVPLPRLIERWLPLRVSNWLVGQCIDYAKGHMVASDEALTLLTRSANEPNVRLVVRLLLLEWESIMEVALKNKNCFDVILNYDDLLGGKAVPQLKRLRGRLEVRWPIEEDSQKGEMFAASATNLTKEEQEYIKARDSAMSKLLDQVLHSGKSGKSGKRERSRR